MIEQELSLSRPLPHSHNSRHHSHSISLGAVNPNHRITRRKSVTTTTAAANAVAAAVAASVKDPSGEPAAVPMPANRRGSGRRPLVESSSVGTPSGLTPPSYFSRSLNGPGINHNPSSGATNFSSAPNAAGPSPAPDAAAATASAPGTASTTKNRNRRASEGSPLVRSEGKRAMAELRCDRCGKGYKHGSCLSKHMCVYSPYAILPSGSVRSIAPCWLCPGRPRGHPAPSFSPYPLLYTPSSCSSSSLSILSWRIPVG